MKRFIAILLSLSCFMCSQAKEKTGSIEVNISGFKNSSGKAGITMFSNSKGFPMQDELALERLFAGIVKSSCSVVLSDIPYGTYALSVFHDENSNNRLDTTIIGLPKEGIGTSNNVKSKFGPPKFKDASFVLGSSEKQLNISLQYLTK
jgi:uncharacterized protein (DUF2141 family)